MIDGKLDDRIVQLSVRLCMLVLVSEDVSQSSTGWYPNDCVL